MTKYAEWVDLPCGLCKILVDIGTIIEKKSDPICKVHEEARCLVCGKVTERGTVGHGSLGFAMHAPKFEEMTR